MPFSPHSDNNRVGVSPSNQTGITNATYKMVGLGAAGWTITPQTSGRVLIFVQGNLVDDTAATTATCQLSYGTSTAPANGATLAGTQQGGQLSWVTLASQLTIPFSMSTIITGLTVGTAAWFDVCAKSAAGTISLTNVNCWAIEI